MNVLHAPVNIGSQASCLSEAENALRQREHLPGRSWSADFDPHAFSSRADVVVPRSPGLLGRLRRGVGPFLYGLRHRREFDVLHLYFGKSLLDFGMRLGRIGRIDLALWKHLGKRIFVTFQGCDVRIRGLSAGRAHSPCQPGVCDVPFCGPALDAKRRQWTAQFLRWADKCFCLNPDLLAFVPGAEFLPYASAAAQLPPPPTRIPRPRPRVVHAPTNRSGKGTQILLAASAQLQATHPHDLILVEGRPHDEALQVYAEADILVDQLRIGWYGALAVEAMALGVTAVAYLCEEDLARIPAAMRDELPIAGASPDTIVAVLGRLLESPTERLDRGRRGLAFARRWHDPQRIARRMLELYENPAESFWERFPG